MPLIESITTINATPWSPPEGAAGGIKEKGQQSHYDLITILDQHITPAVCLLGCAGNLLTLIVLNRRKFQVSSGTKENAAHIGLVALAVSDLLFCLSLVPRMLLRTRKSTFTEKNFELFYQMYATGLITSFLMTSTWTMVTMAVVRYLAICFPLRARSTARVSFSRRLYACVFIAAFLINLPSFWQYKLEELHLKHDVIYIIDIGVMDTHKLHGKIFLWVRVMIGTLIPAIILMFCNSSLIKALQKSSRMRRQYHVSESASSSKNRVTLLLVVILSVFVLSVFPCEFLDIFRDLVQNDTSRTELFLLVRSVANLLQVLNFAFNFVLYCVINAHFRSSVIDLLTCTKYIGSNGSTTPLSRRLSTRVSSFRGTSVMLRYQGVGKGRRWGTSATTGANGQQDSTTMM